MKKVIAIITALLLLLCGCVGQDEGLFGRKYDKDQEYANKQLNSLLKAIENKDEKVVKSLFSKNVLSSDFEFETSVQELFAYFKGVAPKWDSQCPQIIDEENETNQKIIVTSSYDIQTSESAYRICIKSCRKDTADYNNEGIWSLYIILLSEDNDLECTYWGDNKYTPGINIGVPMPLET
ncbi:MAG: DUF5104 domain-containing protein [Clostridia bacterium]|nr:DUF5104 domain-containing protein [Clostridia bacterium]